MIRIPWRDAQEHDFRDFKSDRLNFYLDEFLKRVPKESEIVDIGCGNGYFLADLWSNGYGKIQGIDIVKQAGVEARQLGITVRIEDCHATGFLPSVFDAVCASHVLEHSPVPKALVRELVRITKDGGLIFVELPIAEFPPETGMNKSGHFSFYETKEDAVKLFTDENVEILYHRLGTHEDHPNHFVLIGKVHK